MAETQRRPVPRNDGGELDTATAFLSFARESVLKKADDLSEEQLRRVLVDTGTTILGLIQRLTAAERYWFGRHVLAQMTCETNRHAGHADILREQIDGATGR